MSSAILYLAIIAIWACVLVPRWIHQPHRVLPGQDDLTGTQYSAQAGHSAAGLVPDPAGAPITGQESAAQDAWDESADAAAGLPPSAEQGVAWHRFAQRRSVHIEHPEHQPYPVPGRSRILQARRRLLTTLVALMITALAGTAAKLAPSWILVAPVSMLGLYLLLLREAAVADAEREQWRAAEREQWRAAERAAQAEAAQAEAARLRARQAREAGEAQRTAEIIDISARFTDQLYDQYADAAIRAVGD
ncbi:MAG: hypothetical protein ABSB01_13915 [Streptosporangiaceae bacterium]